MNDTKKIKGMKTEHSSKLRWVEVPEAGLDHPISPSTEKENSVSVSKTEEKTSEERKHDALNNPFTLKEYLQGQTLRFYKLKSDKGHTMKYVKENP